MLFNSWSFAAFLPIVFALHYAARRAAWQIGILTLASFVFYGWENPRLLPLLLVSTLVNGVAAQIILTSDNPEPRRRSALWGALAFNLGALGFFKYAPLVGPWILRGTSQAEIAKAIPLPIGISFYTFQGISLVCEAWWRRNSGLPGLEVPPKGSSKGLWVWFHAKVWFFKAFFPQLIAGPIVKAQEFLHQIEPKAFAKIDWDGAVRKLVLGFFLKMVVADNLKDSTTWLQYPNFQQLPWPNLLLLLYAYSGQIYADFAGYSYIAQGLAKLFGYTLPDNFHHPYLAASLTEFWRRWHISLSTWLREYLYIPLGGNRHGEGRTYFNLFLVMFLGGLWHGASWNFAFWGTAHGLGLALERWSGLGRQIDPIPQWTWTRWIRVIFTFHVVSALWLLFKLSNFAEVGAFFGAIFSAPFGLERQLSYVLPLFAAPVLLQHLWSAWRDQAQQNAGSNTNSRRRSLETWAYAGMLVFILLNAGSPGEFIYFQF